MYDQGSVHDSQSVTTEQVFMPVTEATTWTGASGLAAAKTISFR